MRNEIYSPDYVQDLFDRMSSSYERMNYITSFGFSIRWRRQYLQPFARSNEKVKVIDLLTGMGETWAATKQHFPGSELTALDFSEGMLNFARKKNERKFRSEINIIKRDVLKSGLPGDHFDFVTCAFGLKTFDDEQIRQLARETKRILKPGGQCSFIEVSTPGHFIMKSFYGFYLGRVVPLLGWLFLGNPVEYKMLWQYTRRYVNSKKAAEIFSDEGLSVNYHSYFFGCASGFSGLKK
jgi:demethylmenaquinone methyltransferase/2-methoxy-6-polyprenyl-1,4-benzoquinol methylase